MMRAENGWRDVASPIDSVSIQVREATEEDREHARQHGPGAGFVLGAYLAAFRGDQRLAIAIPAGFSDEAAVRACEALIRERFPAGRCAA